MLRFPARVEVGPDGKVTYELATGIRDVAQRNLEGFGLLVEHVGEQVTGRIIAVLGGSYKPVDVRVGNELLTRQPDGNLLGLERFLPGGHSRIEGATVLPAMSLNHASPLRGDETFTALFPAA